MLFMYLFFSFKKFEGVYEKDLSLLGFLNTKFVVTFHM